MNQRELELAAHGHGRERISDSIKRNEEMGRAESNPYAQKLYREYLFPLRDTLIAEREAKKAGRRQAHAALLAEMDLEVVAYLALRHGISTSMSEISARSVALNIGRAVYHEHLLTQFSEINPKLFYYLMNDLDRRMSSDERHKMAVVRDQATKADIKFKEWSNGSVQQVGYYLLDKMVDVGLFVIEKKRDVTGHIVVELTLSEAAASFVSRITDFVTAMAPYWTPCIEPPKDWVSLDDGGYHTDELRSLDPYMVHTHNTARRYFEVADMSKEFQCINALQRTEWRVNGEMLDTITNLSHHHDMEEILMQADMPKPHKPAFLSAYEGKVDESVLSAEQVKLFKTWKREMSSWYTDEKLRKLKGHRFSSVMASARQFREYNSVYFVYFRDFRGRYYVKSSGISPQGSDLQKALIEFGKGKPMLTQGAKDWFMITGANRFGVDKVTYKDRIKWVLDNEHLILDWAKNPVDSADWMQADKPLQFLAWCLEYAKWKTHGDKFLSRISVGMDGSCNGLQNFSAMLRDEVGGRAVNLLQSLLPNDIYQMVADRATSLLQSEPEDEDGFRTKWLDHVLTRGLVKRSVMTLPYGSRRTSCKDFIISDYLKPGKFPELDPKEYERAAAYLSYRVWSAIGDVVVKAREAMDWLQQAARFVIRSGDDNVRWTTPTGFPVVQVYYESEDHRINTKLCGNLKIRVIAETDDPNLNRHKNGVAPNFVHSLDASHLTAAVLSCEAIGGMSYHMVHDDYGTHAADAPALYEAIRTSFVEMYEKHDMLQEFRTRYMGVEDPPQLGNLDLRQVIDSPYFFG